MLLGVLAVKQRIRWIAVGALLLGTALPLYAYEEGREGYRGNHGFGPHPTMPVPAALVFGGVAISVAAAIARRRRGPGKKARSDSSGEAFGKKK